MKKVFFSIASSIILVAFSTHVALAGSIQCTPAGQPANSGIDTAIGCIPIFSGGNSLNPFMSFILGWGVGVAGGIAFLLILFSGFQIMTSSGNPQKLQSGKELLGAAVSGLLLLIFSAFILRVVGVDILQIF